MKLNQRGWLSPTWLKLVIAIALILGIFFRFANLEVKPYWFDETSTSLKLSGFTDVEVTQQILDGRVISIQDSDADFSHSTTWWNKAEGNTNYYLAQIINRTRHPLIVSDTYFVKVISLSHSLDRKVQFQLVVKPNIPRIPNGSDIFLYEPSPTLQAGLEKEYNLKPVTPRSSDSYGSDSDQPPALWQLFKRTRSSDANIR